MKITSVLTVMLLVSSWAFAEPITFVSEAGCPYVCVDDASPQNTGEPHGLFVDLLRAVFESQGDQLNYSIVPPARAIVQVRDGEKMGYLTMKEAAPDLIYPEQPLIALKYVFWVKAGNHWRYEGVSSLQSVRVGTVLSYHYGSDLQAYFDQYANTDAVQSISGEDIVKRNIQKLMAGRIDTFIEEQYMVEYTLQQMKIPPETLQIAGSPQELEILIYPGFSPALPNASEYVKRFSEGLQAIKQSGQWQRLLSQYGMTE